MMDLELLLQHEATQNQYIFNFVLMNIIFLFSYLFRKNKRVVPLVWVLIAVFLLFAYWGADYFSFRETFYTSLKGFRDPLYYYISLISFNSYTIFRFIIWGSALFLFYKTLKRLKLSLNYSAFIFCVFFLLTFSYARVSLGMAMYFYGVSRLLVVNHKNRIMDLIVGMLFIIGSYWGHRSMLVPILMTPILFVELNKKTVYLFIAIGVVFSGLATVLLSGFASEEIVMDSQLSGFGEAATKYASNEAVLEYNWKFMLTNNLRNYSFIILMVYFVWRTVFSKRSIQIDPSIKRLLSLCCCILIVALSFMSIPGAGSSIIGYRYLYMLGIPLCLILSYMTTNGLCKFRTMFLLLLPALLYSEGFILGKILSF